MIGFDAIKADITTFSGNPLEVDIINFTVANNNNRILCVFIKIIGDAGPDVKWNLNENFSQGFSNVVGSVRHYFYFLLNPTAGNHDLSVKVVASARVFICVASYYNVKQSGIPEDADLTSGSSIPYSLSSTSLTNNAWIVGTVFTSDNVSNETTTGVERIDYIDPVYVSDSLALSDNSIPTAGAASVAGDLSSSVAWSGISIILIPDSQPTTILARPIFFR